MRAAKYVLAGVLVLPLVLAAAIFLLPVEAITYVNEGTRFSNPLHIPPLAPSRIEGGERVFDLHAGAGEVEFVAGRRTKTLGFSGPYLGPTLRARRGEQVRVNVTNALEEATTVHWHGMHLPAVMDGGPHQFIHPGATWRPNWTVVNEAATLWYHPHTLGKTGEHVYRGLAGLFLIDDTNSEQLSIPKAYGSDDIPLVVQDKRLGADGQLIYDDGHVDGEAPGLLDNPPGMLGDTIVVNGTLAPFLDVPAKLVRLRVLNASNARRFNFGFQGDRPFLQIASDGGLLEQPVERTRLLLAPGERAELVVDLRGRAQSLVLMSYAVVDDVSPVVAFLQRFIASNNDENEQFQILELRPVPGDFPGEAIPQTLNAISRLDEGKVTRTRLFTLEFTGRTINSREMDHRRIDEIVKRGDVELWDIRNDAIAFHPFHIHGVQFLVVSRNGASPPSHERGWKDTVIVSAGETVRLIMQFSVADPRVPYMFHCHILEHEDMGMMGQFVVVDDLSAAVSIDTPLATHPGTHRILR